MFIPGQLSWANHELYGFHKCDLNVALLDMLMGRIFKLVIRKVRRVHIKIHILVLLLLVCFQLS